MLLSIRSRFVLLAFFLWSALPSHSQVGQHVERRFVAAIPLPQEIVTPAGSTGRPLADNRAAISLVSGNFFGTGFPGLVTGYATAEGGVLSIQAGVPIATDGGPFDASTHVVSVGMRPDLLTTADLNGDGHKDLVLATQGATAFETLIGDGHGNFASPTTAAAKGRISAVSTWTDPATRKTLVVLGVCAERCAVNMVRADGSVAAAIPFDGTPALLYTARLNGTAEEDLVIGGRSGLVVVEGSSLQTGRPKVERVPVTSVVAVQAGPFVYDRRGLPQLAVLTADGSVRTFARAGLMATLPDASEHVPGPRGQGTQPMVQYRTQGVPWVEVETLPGATQLDPSVTPVMVRGRFSGSGMDDLLILNTMGGGTALVRHPMVSYPATDTAPATTQLLPAVVEPEAGSGQPVLAAVAMRTGADARMGMVTANGSAAPMIVALSASKTINVNSTADGAPNAGNCSGGNTCRLRDAMLIVNNDASSNEASGRADTVNLPAGTYTLSYSAVGNTEDSNGNYEYHMDVNGPFNLVGAGAGATVINANNLDKIFTIDEGFSGANLVTQVAIDAYIAGVTMENGRNRNSTSSNSAGDPNGGALDFDSDGTGDLTLVNCNFTGNTTLSFTGGAVQASDQIIKQAGFGPGTLEIDGGTFSNNISASFGGAVALNTYENVSNMPLIINGTTFTGNSVNYMPSGFTGSTGSGGAVYDAEDQQSGNPQSAIYNSVFIGNTAVFNSSQAPSYGGALYANSGMTIMDSQFLNNTAGSGGGGLYLQSYDYTTSITGSAFTGNQAPDAGAALLATFTTTSTNQTTFQYNVVAGNTASNGRTGLGDGPSGVTTTTAPVTATDNFWGCNQGPTSSGCNTANVASAGSSLTTSPYAVLTATLTQNGAATTTPTAGQAVTLTAGITTDSAGNSLSSNENAFSGVGGTSTHSSSGYTSTSPGGTITETLTITDNGSTLGSSNLRPNTTGTASLTETLTSASGSGTANATVDNAIVSINFTVTAPNLSATSSHTGNFKAGDTADTYTLTIANVGTGPTSGTVTVTDTLPTGFTATALSGSGWTCTLGNVTCTRSDALNASVSYPAITLTVSVASTDVGTYTNSVTVTDPGDSNNGNNTGTDPTTVIGMPTANSQSVTVPFNTAKAITLTGSDPDSPPLALTYSVLTAPSHGALSGTAPNLTYTPTANFQGADSFTFRVNNGSTNSNTATVSITVSPGTPTANSQSVTTNFNTATAITLTGSDPDSPALPLTYTVTTSPTHGTLSGTAPNLTYTPATNYQGADSFTFTVSNGTNTSNTAKVSITDPPGSPTANSQSDTTNFNTAVAITLTGSDPDSPPLTLIYTVTNAPTHGTLSGTAPNLTYTPVANFQGADSFGFSVSNGYKTSNATVSITVRAGTPTANSQSVTTNLNTAAAITLTGTDPDSPALPLTYTVLTAPAHGTLSGTAPNLTYTPTSNYAGADSFTFRVSNGTNTSNTATVSITVMDTLARLQLSGIPATVSPGVPQTLTVTAVGASGTTYTGFTGTVTLTSTDPAAALNPASYTFTPADAGVHNFTVTFNTGGTYSVTATSGSTTASVTTRVGDYIWTLSNTGATNRGTESGSSLISTGGGQTPSLFGGLAFDNSGNSYSVISSNNSVARTSNTDTASPPLTGGGLNAPTAVAVGGAGFVWVTNSGGSSLSLFNASGTAVSGTSGIATASVTAPSALAIDNTGGVWVTNKTAGTVTHLFGAAGPVVVPLANAAGNAQLGVQP